MAKLIQTHNKAQQSLLNGVRQLGEVVTITLGPKGRNVALDKRWSTPAVLHDGVSVAKEIELSDPFENMGVQLVKEAAAKTADRAGDGTTTSTLLAWKLIEKGMRLLEQGVNPMILKQGMELALDKVVCYLQENSQDIQEGDVEKVATISAASSDIGKIIAEAIKRVGEQGVVDIQEGMGEETTIEYKDGMMFDKGYGSPLFVTDKEHMIAEISDPVILYTDMTIDNLDDFADFLGNMRTAKKNNIVIIADSFQGYTLPTLIENHKTGVLRAIAIQAPSFGIKRIWMLEDMATLTGGTVITRQSGRTLRSIKPEELGRCDKVWSDADNTKIIGGKGKQEAIDERKKALTKQIALQESEFEKKSLRERIARLSGGVAIIKVGARTETELKDRVERIRDAVEATKSALAEGIIVGGGVALLQCQKSLHHLQSRPLQEGLWEDPDFLEGIKLVLDVLAEPFKKIITNAGKTPEIILANLEPQQTGNHGYDVVNNKYGNMYEMGIIDPTKVTRQAVENAVSVASMILTTDALISEQDTKEKKEPIV